MTIYFNIDQIEEAEDYLLKATNAEAGKLNLSWPAATMGANLDDLTNETLVRIASEVIVSIADYVVQRTGTQYLRQGLRSASADVDTPFVVSVTEDSP